MKNLFFTLFASTTLFAASAGAEGIEVRELVLKDHKFTPAEITAPADTRIKIIVDNQDPTAAEFESNDFKREKIIPGNSKATIFVTPLKAGEYKFFDEFNEKTAQGILKIQ